MKCPRCSKHNAPGRQYCSVCDMKLYGDGSKPHLARRFAVSAAFVFAVLIAVIAVFGNLIITKTGIQKIRDCSFTSACSVLKLGTSDENKVLYEYALLRTELNNLMLDYNSEKVTALSEKFTALDKSAIIHGKEICTDIEGICTAFQKYQSNLVSYDLLEADISQLSQVFGEYNRLHIKNGGSNVAFTPREENLRLGKWRECLNSVSAFAKTLSSYEDSYIFSFFLHEAGREITDLREDMDELIGKGYGLDDTVRYSDSIKKSFPVVSDGNGMKITLTKPEDYLPEMKKSVYFCIFSDALYKYYC